MPSIGTPASAYATIGTGVTSLSLSIDRGRRSIYMLGSDEGEGKTRGEEAFPPQRAGERKMGVTRWQALGGMVQQQQQQQQQQTQDGHQEQESDSEEGEEEGYDEEELGGYVQVEEEDEERERERGEAGGMEKEEQQWGKALTGYSSGDGSGASLLSSPERPSRRILSCLNCRYCKVKCDGDGGPKCTRCLWKKVDCIRHLGNEQIDDEGYFQVSSALAQVPKGAGVYEKYASLLVEEVKDLYERGGVDRTRAFNTLRVWRMEQEEEQAGRKVADMTWGARAAIMNLLGLSDKDLDGPELPEFPSLGYLPRAALSLDLERVGDLSQSPACEYIDPSDMAVVCTSEVGWVLWMSKTAERVARSKETFNSVMKEQGCFGGIVAAWLCVPSDRRDMMRVVAQHQFGTEMSSRCIVTVIGPDSLPVMRYVVLRYIAIPEHNAVATLFQYKSVPASAYTRPLIQPRQGILDSFRPGGQPPPPSSSSSLSRQFEGRTITEDQQLAMIVGGGLPAMGMGQTMEVVRLCELKSSSADEWTEMMSSWESLLLLKKNGRRQKRGGGGGRGVSRAKTKAPRRTADAAEDDEGQGGLCTLLDMMSGGRNDSGKQWRLPQGEDSEEEGQEQGKQEEGER